MLSQAVCPVDDPGFANSRVHGEQAQRELIHEVLRFCKQKRVAVDVGAHIGLWSRNLAPHFQAVIAFEPVEENARCWAQNVRGWANARLIPVALGDTETHASFEKPKDSNSGMWHISVSAPVPSAQPDLFEEPQKPNVYTLDSTPLQQVDLLKIDTEGYEGRVLRGGERVIRESKPVIVFEDNGLGQKYYGADWIDPKPLLKSWGYRLRLNWRKDQVWMPV